MTGARGQPGAAKPGAESCPAPAGWRARGAAAAAADAADSGLRGRAAGAAGLRRRTPGVPQAEARCGLRAPAAGSPMAPLPRGRWPLLCPGCLGARSARQRRLALLRSRLPVSIVQPRSALLFIFPPPSLAPSLSRPPSLALWLPLWLLSRRRRRPSSSPGSRSLSRGQQ